jgi:predicted RNA-binding Zn-ribbon protein involved in translation (DUF1610 family)
MPNGMPQSDPLQKSIDRAETKPSPSRNCESAENAMICERCGKAEMYRMHAVWRCPECGFKTDCCGW